MLELFHNSLVFCQASRRSRDVVSLFINGHFSLDQLGYAKHATQGDGEGTNVHNVTAVSEEKLITAVKHFLISKEHY